MTEEEYDQKKKEIKYLRERVRRTKLANDKHNAAKAQKKLQEALDATDDKVSISPCSSLYILYNEGILCSLDFSSYEK